MNKKTVVISREWNGPLITVSVNDTSIDVSMSLAEFIDALAEEIGNPMLVVTTAGLRSKMVSAADEVCRKMKRETLKAI